MHMGQLINKVCAVNEFASTRRTYLLIHYILIVATLYLLLLLLVQYATRMIIRQHFITHRALHFKSLIDKVLLGLRRETFLKSPTESWTQSCRDRFIAWGDWRGGRGRSVLVKEEEEEEG